MKTKAYYTYIVRCSDENLGQMIEMNYERCATDNLLAMYDKDPKMFDFNLSSDKSVQFYYNNLSSAFISLLIKITYKKIRIQ